MWWLLILEHLLEKLIESTVIALGLIKKKWVFSRFFLYAITHNTQHNIHLKIHLITHHITRKYKNKLTNAVHINFFYVANGPHFIVVAVWDLVVGECSVHSSSFPDIWRPVTLFLSIFVHKHPTATHNRQTVVKQCN